MVVQRAEPVALAVRHGQGSSHSNPSNRKPLHCSYCDRDHHVQETCWMLNGYPPKHLNMHQTGPIKETLISSATIAINLQSTMSRKVL
jgi:hypothetical protein